MDKLDRRSCHIPLRNAKHAIQRRHKYMLGLKNLARCAFSDVRFVFSTTNYPRKKHYYLTHCFPCINGFNVRDGWDGFNVRDGWLECDKCMNICFTVQTHVDNVVIPYTGEKESNSVLQLNWSTFALLTNGISEIGWRLMPSTCTVKYVLILLGFMTKVRFCWPVLSIVPPIYCKYLHTFAQWQWHFTWCRVAHSGLVQGRAKPRGAPGPNMNTPSRVRLGKWTNKINK